MANNKIDLGITLYSLTFDYITGVLDLEGCLRRAKEMGYNGIELVASMMVPEYPYPSEEWMAEFSALLKKYDLEPICYSGYIDLGLRSDRDLTDEEKLQFTINDMVYASKMGFKIMRSQYSLGVELMERLIPLAKKLKVILAVELHHPHNPTLPLWQDYLKLFREKGEGWLGVVPDFGIFQERPHKLFLDQALERGFRADMLEQVLALHASGADMAAVKALPLVGEEPAIVEEIYDSFHPVNLEYLDMVIPYSPYIHGKFYYIDENFQDNCIPYEALLRRVVDLGYEGYIATEYEGHHFTEKEPAQLQLQRFVTMCRRILGGNEA